jgi:hypothetical protein
VNLVQLPPQFTNVTVVNNTNAGTLCTPSLQVTDSTIAYDMAAPGNYNNFHDYEVLRANRSIFPTWGNELIITPTYLAPFGNAFGSAVALSGDGSTLAIGSTAAFVSNLELGAETVSLYRRVQNSWVFTQQIQPTFPPAITPAPLIGFGTSVALSYDGSILAIGAPGSLVGQTFGSTEPTSGTVYLYAYTSNGLWSLSQTILGTSIGFGINVDLSATGQYLAICINSSAAITGFSIGFETPSVTVYERQNTCTNTSAPWTFQAQLKPILNGIFFTQETSTFSYSKHMALSADGTTIALGCPAIPLIGSNTCVFLFQCTGSTWQQIQTLSNSMAQFGTSVALSANGKYLAVGLFTDIHIYARRGTTWQLEATPSPFVNLATSLSFSADGTVLVAGGAGQNSTAGSLALVVRGPDSRWSTITKFPGSTTGDQLGWSCACSADGAIIAGGATQVDSSGTGYAVVLRSIGSTIPKDTVVSGSLCVYHRTTLDSTLKVAGNIHLQGTLVTGTAGHVTACTVPTSSPSDKHIKDDIVPLDPHKVLEIIRSLRPIHFSFNDSTEAIRQIGFVAQELEQLLPYCVKTQTTADGRKIKMIYLHHEFYAYFIGALQKLVQRVQKNSALLPAKTGLSIMP